jgi:uncharacterized protein YndB with AHSA1/START domain
VARTSLVTEDPVEAVWAVLTDGWRYAGWVVGAKAIRDVDASFPEPGSKLHHRFGVGRFTIDDSTVVEGIEPQRRLVLRARARPAGSARVVVELEPTPEGGTEIHIEEHPVSGLAKRIDNPLLRGAVAARNLESLRRLKNLAEAARSR